MLAFFALLPLEGWGQPLCQPVEMAEPPSSEIRADRLTIGISRDHPRALIVFGLDGCFVGHSWISPGFARDLIGEGV